MPEFPQWEWPSQKQNSRLRTSSKTNYGSLACLTCDGVDTAQCSSFPIHFLTRLNLNRIITKLDAALRSHLFSHIFSSWQTFSWLS